MKVEVVADHDRGSYGQWNDVARQLRDGATLRIDGVSRAQIYSAMRIRHISARVQDVGGGAYVVWMKNELR